MSNLNKKKKESARAKKTLEKIKVEFVGDSRDLYQSFDWNK